MLLSGLLLASLGHLSFGGTPGSQEVKLRYQCQLRLDSSDLFEDKGQLTNLTFKLATMNIVLIVVCVDGVLGSKNQARGANLQSTTSHPLSDGPTDEA